MKPEKIMPPFKRTLFCRLTIIQETGTFWVQWSPESGLIFADTDAKFTEEIVVPLKGDLNENSKGGSKVVVSSHLTQINKSLNNFHKEKSSSSKEDEKNEMHEIFSESATTLNSIITKADLKVSGEEETHTVELTDTSENGEKVIEKLSSSKVPSSEENGKEKSTEKHASKKTTKFIDEFQSSLATEKPFSIRILTESPKDQSDEEEEIDRVQLLSSGEKVDKSGHKNKTIKKPSETIF